MRCIASLRLVLLFDITTTITMQSELQTARDQLALVNLSLEADPTNADFLKLKTELLELIELTQAAIDKTSGSSGSGGSKPSQADKGKGKAKESNWQDLGTYKAGMDCMAKYKDGK
jgi:survival-of-motor-neuron-related-splicing factor 30